MKILITGASGFIGRNLLKRLSALENCQIKVLRRKSSCPSRFGRDKIQEYYWDMEENFIDERCMEGVEYVVHLAGEGVFEGRWTQHKKKKIYDSRVNGTRMLVDLIKRKGSDKIKLISTSAIGFYESNRDDALTEESANGNDFLSNVCLAWEQEALKYPFTSIVRVGLVLGKEGGAFKKMITPFKFGLGGKLSNGLQYMSWIHVDDLIEIFLWLIFNKEKIGIYNGVAPEPVLNEVFTKTLGKKINRPTLFSAPGWLLKIILGEKSLLLLNGQKVVPKKLISEGFIFRYPNLSVCLDQLLLQ